MPPSKIVAKFLVLYRGGRFGLAFADHVSSLKEFMDKARRKKEKENRGKCEKKKTNRR